MPPFISQKNENLFKKIHACKWNENCPDPAIFREDDGADFIIPKETKRATQSLNVFFELVFVADPKMRATSQVLVNDKFIKSQQDKYTRLNKGKVNEIFTNIKTFKTQAGL